MDAVLPDDLLADFAAILGSAAAVVDRAFQCRIISLNISFPLDAGISVIAVTHFSIGYLNENPASAKYDYTYHRIDKNRVYYIKSSVVFLR